MDEVYTSSVGLYASVRFSYCKQDEEVTLGIIVGWRSEYRWGSDGDGGRRERSGMESFLWGKVGRGKGRLLLT